MYKHTYSNARTQRNISLLPTKFNHTSPTIHNPSNKHIPRKINLPIKPPPPALFPILTNLPSPPPFALAPPPDPIPPPPLPAHQPTNQQTPRPPHPSKTSPRLPSALNLFHHQPLPRPRLVPTYLLTASHFSLRRKKTGRKKTRREKWPAVTSVRRRGRRI